MLNTYIKKISKFFIYSIAFVYSVITSFALVSLIAYFFGYHLIPDTPLIELLFTLIYCILVLIIMFLVLKISKNYVQNPLTHKNYKLISKLSYTFVIVTITSIIYDTINDFDIGNILALKGDFIYIFGIAFSNISAIFLSVSLAFLVISDVYKKAVEIKEENDYTI